nr:hypothetical protein [Tanacetum cinerariifolium]
MSNGVFGIRDSSKGQVVGDIDVEEDSVRMDSEVPCDVISGMPEPFPDCDKDVMVFDEELVKEGSEKWKFTVCGYIVGMECRGISALASRLGRPIKIDQVTTDMCRASTGRLGYARVLVEINATDAFFDKIEINYMDEMKKVKSTKWARVEYTWKPDRCSHCNVFGHSVQICDAKPKPKPVQWKGRKRNVVMRKMFLKNEDQATQSFMADEILGNGCDIKQKEIKKFIAAEKIQICAILETHLKTENISRACDYVFGRWRWASNVFHSTTSCRIMARWNSEEVDVMVVQSCSQTILCLVEIIHTKSSHNVNSKRHHQEKNPLGLLTMLLLKDEFLELVNEERKHKKLKVAQSNMDADPFNLAKRQIAVNLVNEYTKVAEDELKLLHQKAKIQWLKEDGSRVEGDLVNGQFVKHFQNFLGTTYLVLPLSFMGNIVKLKLSEVEALYMIKEVSDIEIKEALFDIDSSKAASPDGYNSCFFKKAWGVIEADICLAVREFFISSRILGEINATVITLVPKVNTPNKISDFRPIACCNVLYKCISKILTNRIKDGLSKVDFLREVMLMVGFHDTMVHWIMTCITSVSFSICINGEINGFFKGGRGLRQGDPILPYLFTLVMEVFNMIMIKTISESGKFKYHYDCKELKLTHMCFADDLMVLCNGDIESLKVVKKSLDDFSDVSGLFLYLSKSTIFFGSTSETLKEDMLRLLPFKCGKLPMKYLGVPLLAKRLGVKDCQSLIDNVENRITCSRNKFLSYAGRIRLIAYVLSDMHQYWASVYMIPTSVTNELEKIFKRFLWNSGGSAKGKAKVSWKNVCRPKVHGGIGFKPMHKWNAVLLISQLWKLIEKKESLWVKWVSTVKLKGKSIREAEIDNNDSHGWKELIRIRDKIKPYVIFKIGDGRWKWADEWSSRFPELCQIDVPLLSHERDKAVWICKVPNKPSFCG